MRQTVNIKVLFTRQNAKMCICWECPVQAKSQCIKENEEKMGDVLTTRFFEPKVVPGLYCASGTASCRDIDTSQGCICGGCEVYNNNRLDKAIPAEHFCKNGNAH
jgi:hypothetical protein